MPEGADEIRTDDAATDTDDGSREWAKFSAEADARLQGQPPPASPPEETKAGDAGTGQEADQVKDDSAGADGAGSSPSAEDGGKSPAPAGADKETAAAGDEDVAALRDRLARAEQRIRSDEGRVKKAQLVLRKHQYGELDDLNPDKAAPSGPSQAALDEAALDPEKLTELRDEFPSLKPVFDSIEVLAQAQKAQSKTVQETAGTVVDMQIGAAETAEQDAYATAVAEAHGDFVDVVKSTEFADFVAKGPPLYRRLWESDEPGDGIELISAFKTANTKPADDPPPVTAADTTEQADVRQQRLKSAADPLTGGQGGPKPKVVDNDDGEYWEKHYLDDADKRLRQRMNL